MKFTSIVLMLLLFSPSLVMAKKSKPGRVEFLIDASASMSSSFGNQGGNRIGAIRASFDVLLPVLRDYRSEKQIAFRIFGGRFDLADPEACRDTHLLMTWTRASAITHNHPLDTILSRGASPLEAALRAAAGDFGQIQDKDTLVLLLDDLDSCEGRPLEELENLRSSGLEIFVVGLGLGKDSQVEISQAATFVKCRNETELVSTLLSGIGGFPLDKTGVAPTRVVIRNKEEDAQYVLGGSMVSKPVVVQSDSFPLTVDLAPGSIWAAFRAEQGRAIPRIVRFPVLPGHEAAFQIPSPSRVVLELNLLDSGWGILPMARVRWSGGPAGSLRIVLQEKDAPGASWMWADSVAGSTGSIQIPLPERRGIAVLQLRKYEEMGESILGEIEIDVPGHRIRIESPSRIPVDNMIPITWGEIAGPGDFLTMVPAGAAYEKTGRPRSAEDGLELDMNPPPDLCTWEIRYYSGLSNTILSRAAVELFDRPAGLLLPEAIIVSREFELDWYGPGGKGDAIILVRDGEEDSEYLSWAEAEESPVLLTAPKSPGDYRIRYLTENGEILAEVPVKVGLPVLRMEALPTARPGARIRISWSGSPSSDDMIVLALEGAPITRKIDFFYVSIGSPFSLEAPAKPGNYELRYISGHEILQTLSLLVE